MSESQSAEHRVLSDLWWFLLLRGIVLLALGIVFLTRPGVPLTMAILLMGAYWFIDGILTVIRSIKERGVMSSWGFGLFVGVVSLIAGLVVFAHPVASALLTTTFLVYFLAFAALVSGFTSLATGIRAGQGNDEITQNAWYLIGGGAISMAFGILLIASPLYSILFLVKSIGVIALILGVIQLIFALRARSALKQAQ